MDGLSALIAPKDNILYPNSRRGHDEMATFCLNVFVILLISPRRNAFIGLFKIVSVVFLSGM